MTRYSKVNKMTGTKFGTTKRTLGTKKNGAERYDGLSHSLEQQLGHKLAGQLGV